MTQEFRLTIQLTLECDNTLSKELVEDRVKAAISLDGDLVDIITIDTIEIKEEAELYQVEETLEEYKMSRYFDIISVSKNDILELVVKDDKNGNSVPRFEPSIIKKLSTADMERIASKLADDYCNQLFWSSLAIITQEVIDSK